MQATAEVTPASLRSLFDVIFSEPVTVYTSDSEYGEVTKIFSSPSDALEYFEGKHYVGYALHYADTGGHVEDRRVKLDPSICKGHDFRYSVGGWGLIHVQLKNQRGALECRIVVNTSKRAGNWADIHPEFGDPALWRWPVVEKHARKLIRHLKKVADHDKYSLRNA